MTNKKNSKFNSTGHSKGYFPLKKHRFDTAKHPIVQSSARCSAKLKAHLSQQEELMVVGLVNCLQCNEREAVRIAIYELINSADADTITTLAAAAKAGSNIKGHSSRDRAVSLSLPVQEKADLLELADQLCLSDKEVLRLAIIYLAKGIRTEGIKRLTRSPKISQEQLAKEWSRANQGKPPSDKTKALKSAAAEAYKEAADLGDLRDYERYKERGRMMDVLNWEGVGRIYAEMNPDGSRELSLDIVDAHLIIEQGDQAFEDELIDEIEQLAEDRRKAAYTEAIAARWAVEYGIELTGDELDFYWQDFLDRTRPISEAELAEVIEWSKAVGLKIWDDPTESPAEPTYSPTPRDDNLSRLDQQPDELGRDWWLRISGPQIVERMEQAPEPVGAENRWWLRLTGRQKEAAEAIQLETKKTYEHITLAEINAKADEQARD